MLSDSSDQEYSNGSSFMNSPSNSTTTKRSSRSSQRGGEAPMEIDSPPPLWLKSPQQENNNYSNYNNNSDSLTGQNNIFTPSVMKTPSVAKQEETNSTPSASSLASPKLLVSPSLSSMSAPVTPLPQTVGMNSSPVPVQSAPTQPRSRGTSVTSTPGRSPLRSCHTNNNNPQPGDAVLHLRRLTTATYPTTSPQNFYSPFTSPFGSSASSKMRSPLTRPKRFANLLLRDPTKVAAAAALVSSSTTAWHLHLPLILMNYIQLFFNTLVGAGVLYLLFSATVTVLHDAQLKVDERLQVMLAEIALCSRQYIDNRCSPELRVPAMEKACMEWETCMSRDPSTTSRARLHAETIAEILNGFFGAISTRTFLFMVGGTVLLLGLFNAAFYFGKSSTHARAQHSNAIVLK